MNKELLAALMLILGVTKEEEITEAGIKSLTKADTNSARKATRFSKVVALGAAKDAKLDEADDAGFEKFTSEHTIVSLARHGELVQAKVDLKAIKLAGDPVTLKRQVEELTTANGVLSADAAEGKAALTAKRDAVKLYYEKGAGDKKDDAVLGMIAKASSVELDGLLKQFGGDAAVKFGATCTKCNTNEHISMRSSIPTPEGDGGKSADAGNSIAEIRERRTAGTFGNPNHGTTEEKK